MIYIWGQVFWDSDDLYITHYDDNTFLARKSEVNSVVM